MNNKQLKASRARRYRNMTDDELERLNSVLCSRVCWVTAERVEVCKELGRRMSLFFKQHRSK